MVGRGDIFTRLTDKDIILTTLDKSAKLQVSSFLHMFSFVSQQSACETLFNFNNEDVETLVETLLT